MKTHIKRRLLWPLAAGFIASLLIGCMLDKILLCFCAFLSLYLIWNIAQLFRLLLWLEQTTSSNINPPKSYGLWRIAFEAVHRVKEKQVIAKSKLHEIIERIQKSTAALDDGIIMIDSFGYLEWWNRAAEEQLGLKDPNHYGEQITYLLKNNTLLEYFKQNNHQQNIEFLSPVNNNRHLQMTKTVYGEGGRLLFVRDITRINQLETMRKDFVANVSHELRTPLTVISGYLETLLDTLDVQKYTPPVWEKALHRMQEQSIRMKSLVSDLLLLSRLESVQPYTPENIPLKPLLNQIISDANALNNKNRYQIILQCSKYAYIRGSQSELRSAFSNLIFNAIRYTPSGGTIKVILKKSKKGVRILVEDNGLGIDPIHIPRLTERFYRIDKGRSVSTGGTGLGLAIVKHVLLRHGGRLNISSKLGDGSCFTCHFPKEKIYITKDDSLYKKT